MSTWLSKITTNNAQPQTLVQQTPSTALSPLVGSIIEQPRVRDPNAPDYRLQINQRCIYERRLPGDAYITAHVQRLQAGYYDTPQTHEPAVRNVRFVSVTFVFHPSRRINRFTSAGISIALHTNPDEQQYQPDVDFKKPFGKGLKPRFLKHAPHLLYGAISPETLNWNFNVAGSLGVSQTPVSASLAPSGGMKGSYKLYDMMKIQGSVRSLRSWQGREYDLEDGEMVWTLEENGLQKSGLPREFTFVMLVTKGDAENVMFDVEIKPTVRSWFGHFPRWYTSFAPYKPIHTQDMDLDEEVGQVFEPTVGNEGFNFATLARGFDDFVSLPGTTYSTTDNVPSGDAAVRAKTQTNPGQTRQQPQAGAGASAPQDNTLNVRVYFDGVRGGTPSGESPAPDHPHMNIPLTVNPRTQSLRRSRSRSELMKEYGTTQGADTQQKSSTGTPPINRSNPYSQPSAQNGEPKLRVLSEISGTPPTNRSSYAARQNGGDPDRVRSQASPSGGNSRRSYIAQQETTSQSDSANQVPARTQSTRQATLTTQQQTDSQGRVLFGELSVRNQNTTRRLNHADYGIDVQDRAPFHGTPVSSSRSDRRGYPTPPDDFTQDSKVDSESPMTNHVNHRPYAAQAQDKEMTNHKNFESTIPVPVNRSNSRRLYNPAFPASQPETYLRKRLSPEVSVADRSNRHSFVAPPEYGQSDMQEDNDLLAEMQRPQRISPRSQRPHSSYIPSEDIDSQLRILSNERLDEQREHRRFSYQPEVDDGHEYLDELGEKI